MESRILVIGSALKHPHIPTNDRFVITVAGGAKWLLEPGEDCDALIAKTKHFSELVGITHIEIFPWENFDDPSAIDEAGFVLRSAIEGVALIPTGENEPQKTLPTPDPRRVQMIHKFCGDPRNNQRVHRHLRKHPHSAIIMRGAGSIQVILGYADFYNTQMDYLEGLGYQPRIFCPEQHYTCAAFGGKHLAPEIEMLHHAEAVQQAAHQLASRGIRIRDPRIYCPNSRLVTPLPLAT